MGRRRAFAFVAIGLGAAVRSACPALQPGLLLGPDATFHLVLHLPAQRTGTACEQIHCQRGDDPLTQSQVSRAIALTVTAPTGGEVDGRLRFFLGEGVLLRDARPATCSRAISSLPTVKKASCSQTTDRRPSPSTSGRRRRSTRTRRTAATPPPGRWSASPRSRATPGTPCTLKGAVASNVRSTRRARTTATATWRRESAGAARAGGGTPATTTRTRTRFNCIGVKARSTRARFWAGGGARRRRTSTTCAWAPAAGRRCSPCAATGTSARPGPRRSTAAWPSPAARRARPGDVLGRRRVRERQGRPPVAGPATRPRCASPKTSRSRSAGPAPRARGRGRSARSRSPARSTRPA